MELTFFLLLSFSFHCHAKPNIQSIFSFGDSYADTGNIAVLDAANMTNGPIISDYSPYGETFFHHPTGRFSDGRLVIDFIAQEFGLPLVPPYLARKGSFRQGANFAVSGATGLDFSFFVEHNVSTSYMLNTSLSVQLGWFEEFKSSLCNTTKECRHFFGKSLFYVGEIGINDYTNSLFNGKNISDVRNYIPTLVETISEAIERLIRNGAQTILVAGIPPYGCLPIILYMFPSRNKMDYEAETGCLKKYNELSMIQNYLLRESVTKLRCKFPQVKIIFADHYSPIIDLLKSPKQLGFIGKPLRVCCGEGGRYNFNITKACGLTGVNLCKNPLNYLNWDGTHLTEAAYQYIANGWLNGSYVDPPILSVCRAGHGHWSVWQASHVSKNARS